MMTLTEIIGAIDDFNEDNFLQHGNSEIIFEEHRGLIVTIEAINHTTLNVELNMKDIETMKKHHNINSILLERYSEIIREFDVDDVFTELWSQSFAEHNKFTPGMFLDMLKEDEEHFENVLQSA
ncbi:hypothetical protein [Staphylococcus argenteus]|uniref:hypothetical protein n=1 Tax=Staphylococcus TaxID=1279 RepID=UPI000E332A2F|nr:hypothetical protein [Staphylococcus argenteus]BBD87500.1 hypothetical protein SA58113_p20056 [Staphylococcus argenteus]